MYTLSETRVVSAALFYHALAILPFILFPLLCLPVVSPAQPAGLKIGDMVRIKAPSITERRITGKISNLSDQSMQVVTDIKTIAIPYNNIESMDVARGKQSNAMRGLLLGGAGGLVVGGIIGALNYEPCKSTEFLGCGIISNSGENLMMGALMGGILGGIGGLVVGFLTPSPIWQPVPIQPSVTLVPTDFDKRNYHPVITLRWSFR